MTTKKILHGLSLAGFMVLAATLITACDKLPGAGDRAAIKGYALLNKGKYFEAAEAFETALEQGLNLQEPEMVYTCLGNAYNELEEWNKSIVAHRKSLAINPGYHQAWVNMGIVYRLTGEFSQAEDCYAKALELAPDYAELHASIGALYIHQGTYSNAVVHLEKATSLDSQLAVSWSNLAFAYATVGRFDEAQTALKRAVILGYKNGPLIQERINELKYLADADSSAADDTINGEVK